MQAWQVHENGEPSEVMRLEEVATPTPGTRGLTPRWLDQEWTRAAARSMVLPSTGRP